MAIVVGINFAIALRLIGWVPQFYLSPFNRFYQIHWIGALVVLLSGIGLLLAYPAKALTNPVFYLKFAALSIGLLIAAWLQKQIQSDRLRNFVPAKIKAIAVLSIVLLILLSSVTKFHHM